MEASHDKIESFSDGQKSLTQRNQQDCAFDGAMKALVGIDDAVHLVHGPSGCVGPLTVNKIRFSTDMEESNIIFGGAKKLYKAILEVYRRYKPQAIFVYSTCVSAMIGDDINGATHDASQKLGIPVIPVDSPGFIGNKNSGIRLAGDILLEHVIGTVEPELTTEYDINLIGDNLNDGAVEIESLLGKLGVRVLAKITGNSKYKQIAQAHRVKLNVVISSKPLLKLAKQMSKQYGISYIEESLYSLEEINNCLRNVAIKLNDNFLIKETEKLILEETNKINFKLDIYRSYTKNKKVLIDVTNDNFSIITIAKLLNLNIIPIVEQLNPEDKLKIKNVIILNKKNEKNQILQIIQDESIDMLIAPLNYQFIAIQAQIPFFNNQNQHTYIGYTGIIKAVQELYTAFNSPVWKQFNQSALWE